MKDGYFILLQKLENFIKRYYRFKILKGFLLFFTLVFLIVLFESLIEYYNYTSIVFRTGLFYLSILFFLLIATYYIILPALSLFKIGKRLNFKDASKIISEHFDLVDDNLINTIELGKDIKANHNETDLLLASIQQRTKLLNPIPFHFAISVKNFKTAFIYFGLSTLVIFSIFSFAPGIFKEGAYRIIDYNNYYEQKAPFRFIIQNADFLVKKGDDFTIDVLLEGDYIPNELYISISGNTFLMIKDKENKNEFTFTIKNLNNSISVFLVADSYKSKKYKIEVLVAPILKNFVVEIFPPNYTGVEHTVLKNSGDLNIPFGSTVKWKFQTTFADTLFLAFANDTLACKKEKDLFAYSKQMLKSGIYAVMLKNENFILNNDISYSVNIIPDLFPEITVNSIEDSLKLGLFYYILNVKDDYGFSNLKIKYRVVNEKNTSANFSVKNIDLNKRNRNQDVFYNFDFSTIKLNSENEFVEYYFEIFDNDYISGYKSTKSALKSYRPFSVADIKNKIDEHQNETSKNLDDSKKLVKDIKKQIEDFKRKELNNKLTEWEKKNFLKNISSKQKELDKLLDKIKKENSKKNNLNNQLYKENQDILNKQKEIQKILDELMDEELKALLEEIDKLQKEFNSNEFDKLKEKMDLSYDELNKNLDKSLELLKRFQVEEKVQNLSEDIDRLAKRQENLSEKEYKKSDREEQKVNQKSIKEQFKDIEKEFEKTLKKNEELKRPYKLDNFEKDFDDIEQKLEKIENELENKSDKKINKQRKETSDSMKELSEKMEEMMQEMSSQSLNMNLKDLRQIIENLNTFSFTQEDVYNDLRVTYSNDPKFFNLINNQKKLNDDFKMIEDSLNTLAGRIPQMNKLISTEVKELKYSLGKTLYEFEQRHRRASIRYQRNIINSSNKLALYLEELNDQLQNQQSQSSSGKGKKQKPGNAMKKMKMQMQQESLKKQLEQLLEQLKKNGGKKSGKEISKGVVKSLAEQEIFNKMLKELQNAEGISPETMKQLKEIKRLSDKNIDDLINKNITQDLLKRNERIKSRLLEAEKSEREREKEKIRESNEGTDVIRKFPKEIEEFLKKNQQYKETLQKNNINLKKYYQNLSNEYYQRIK